MARRPSPLVFRPRRPKRPRPVVVIITLLGFVFAMGALYTASAVLAGGDPTVRVIEAPGDGPDSDSALITLNALSVDAVAGQMRVRVTIVPGGSLLDAGTLKNDLTVVVNNASGATSQTISAGDPVQPAEVTVSLTDGAVSQYPFDSYESLALIRVTEEDGTDSGRVVPLTVAVQSNLDGFEMSAEADSGGSLVDVDVAVVDISISRSWASFVYSFGVMGIMLALAFTGLRIIWATYSWQVVSPPWLYGFFIGALFALPPLRSSLPGAPPAGAIVDYLSFYPAVAVIAVALLVVLSHWLAGVKPLPSGETREASEE